MVKLIVGDLCLDFQYLIKQVYMLEYFRIGVSNKNRFIKICGLVNLIEFEI